MVGKKSEYQKQFSPAILLKHIPIYEDNLACRYRRRDQQFAHTSIAWDDSSESTSEEDLRDKLEDLKLQEKSTVSSKEEILRTKSPTKVDKCIETQLSVSSDDNNTYIAESGLSDGELKKIRKEDFGKTRVISSGKKKKIKRPDKSEKIPKKDARPSTAPAKVTRRPRTPFVSYGAGDGDRYSGKLWTHNVLADTDVYPAALRAKEKREEEMKKKINKREKYMWLDQRKKNAILKLMKKQTSDWETEYKRHYPAYDKIIYERALSSRPDISSRGEY